MSFCRRFTRIVEASSKFGKKDEACSASGARFSEVPKLVGRISGDIIHSMSSRGRRLEAGNFAVI